MRGDHSYGTREPGRRCQSKRHKRLRGDGGYRWARRGTDCPRG